MLHRCVFLYSSWLIKTKDFNTRTLHTCNKSLYYHHIFILINFIRNVILKLYCCYTFHYFSFLIFPSILGCADWGRGGASHPQYFQICKKVGQKAATPPSTEGVSAHHCFSSFTLRSYCHSSSDKMYC